MSNHALGMRTPDVETPNFTIEVKHRKQLPQWIEEAMRQAVRNATPDKLPLLVLHERGRHHGNDLVVVRLSDFQEWFGEEMVHE